MGWGEGWGVFSYLTVLTADAVQPMTIQNAFNISFFFLFNETLPTHILHTEHMLMY